MCVTGGAGFIGSYLTEMLVEEGAEVTVADNLERGSFDRIASIKDSIRLVRVDLGTAEGPLEKGLKEMIAEYERTAASGEVSGSS